jgi:hypothetical protein
MHCNDGPDIMCYPDNGSRSDYHANVCSRLHWDCNFDDYFNVTPKPRSYLATHWNLGSPLNRFFAGCGYHTGDLSVGTLSGVTGQDPDALVKAQAGDWAPIATRTYSVPKSCRGRPFAVSGFPRIPSQVDHQDDPTGQLIQGFVINNFWPGLPELPVPDYNVCFYKGSRQLRCAIETGDDTGKVPTSATRVRVLFNGGPPGIFVLNMM